MILIDRSLSFDFHTYLFPTSSRVPDKMFLKSEFIIIIYLDFMHLTIACSLAICELPMHLIWL